MKKEIEIKTELNKGERIRSKLKSLGAFPVKPKYTQTTYGFFSGDSIKKGIFPRIRMEDKRPVLTIKVKDTSKKTTNYFERKEYNYYVSSVKKGTEMLKLLGYERIRKFTKIREEWSYPRRKVYIALDKLYFGRFLEIEGEKMNIEATLRDLGLEKRKRITKAYLAVEDDFKKRKRGSEHS